MFGCSSARQSEASRRKIGLWFARDECCRSNRLCPLQFHYLSPRRNTWTAARGAEILDLIWGLIWGPLAESSSTFPR